MKFSGLRAIRSLVHLVFPQVCVACEDEVPLKNRPYCFSCQQELHYTDHVENKGNEFEKMFYGRIPLERGAAMLYFRKNTVIHDMMHNFKYKGNKSIGIQLGKEFGETLKAAGFLHDINVITPVPMYWKKEKRRGYNQATIFASGISLATGIPLVEDLLLKTASTESQTRKSRIDRLENVERVFQLNDKHVLENDHILLVDDVLTTGATLEACAKKLDLSNNKVSMVTLAIGRL